VSLVILLQVLLHESFYFCRQKALAKQASERKSLIGTGDRSERVRTYNFGENRITDHRVGLTVHGIQDMLAGLKLDTFTEKLREQDEKDRIMAMLESANSGLSMIGTERS
jgi:peptide chain release factor 1